MREIKFRGLNENGFFIYGCLVTDGKDSPNKDLAWIFPEDANEYSFDLLVKVSLKTVGELTGLKDKNNVEIYEGDILTHKQCNKGLVTWLEKRGGFFILFNGVNTDIIQRKPEYISAFKMNAFKWEVIGNIHQNPELIK